MRCSACKKKCFPMECAYCHCQVCVPCRTPDKHTCLTKDQLVKRYEEKLTSKFGQDAIVEKKIQSL